MKSLAPQSMAPNTRAAPLVVVFNPGSGGGDPAEQRDAIRTACTAAGRALQLLEVDAAHPLTMLAGKAARQALATGAIVVAAGGDGTLNALAQTVVGSGCAFGVLPLGTFNYFARGNGVPTELDAALHLLLSETARPVQVGLVNERVFLVNASLGLYPRLLQEREAWKQKLGRNRFVAFGAGLATLLRGHRNLRLEIELDGQRNELRTPTLVVGNNALQLEQLGCDAQARDVDAGRLAGIALRPLSRTSLLALSVRGAAGRLAEAAQVENFSFRSLEVRPRRAVGSWPRMTVATDGEILQLPMPLRIRVGPEPLWLIRPEGLAPERAALRARHETAR